MLCNLCPRKCNVDRKISKGACKAGDSIRLARAALHFWEEPCLSGKNGSGAVFFSGCPLRCCFCQNYEISHECFGKEISDERLETIFDGLIEAGAENINLVSPTPYLHKLIPILKKYRSSVPVVYNSSGYESVETLKALEGLIDVYLPDLKYISDDKSMKYSGVNDYFEMASAAITEMKRQQREDIFSKDGMMLKGVIIRHLILPKNTNQSLRILDHIASHFGTKTYLSLMAQYTPHGKIERFPELNRKITSREYDKVVSYALDLGFENLFLQELSAADENYIPPFDLTGV